MRKETTEEKKYVAPEVRVIDIAANALICTSATTDDPWTLQSEENW